MVETRGCIIFLHRPSGFFLELPKTSNGWSRLKENHDGEAVVELSHGGRNPQAFSSDSPELIRRLERTPAAFPLQSPKLDCGNWQIDLSAGMVIITNVSGPKRNKFYPPGIQLRCHKAHAAHAKCHATGRAHYGHVPTAQDLAMDISTTVAMCTAQI